MSNKGKRNVGDKPTVLVVIEHGFDEVFVTCVVDHFRGKGIATTKLVSSSFQQLILGFFGLRIAPDQYIGFTIRNHKDVRIVFIPFESIGLVPDVLFKKFSTATFVVYPEAADDPRLLGLKVVEIPEYPDQWYNWIKTFKI